MYNIHAMEKVRERLVWSDAPQCGNVDRRDPEVADLGNKGAQLALQPILNALEILSIDASDTLVLRLLTSRDDRSLFTDFDRSMPDPYILVSFKGDF
jgi:hypothetical protein